MIRVSIRRTATVLLSVVVILCAAHLLAHYLRIYHGWDVPASSKNGLVELFDLGSEVSIPTWYTQALLICGAFLSWLVVYVKTITGKEKRYWLGIAAILLYMSVDEGSAIHEFIGVVINNKFIHNPSGILAFVWVTAGIVAVLLVVTLFFRFWWRLPSKTRALFALAAATYVVGALGLEMVEGYYATHYGIGYLYYCFYAIEESMEMMGVIIYIIAVLDLLKNGQNIQTVRIKLT